MRTSMAGISKIVENNEKSIRILMQRPINGRISFEILRNAYEVHSIKTNTTTIISRFFVLICFVIDSFPMKYQI